MGVGLAEDRGKSALNRNKNYYKKQLGEVQQLRKIPINEIISQSISIR